MKRVWAPVFGLLACCLGAGYLAQETQPPVSVPEKTPAKAAPHIVRGIGFVEPTTEIRRLFFRADGVIDACAVEVGQTARRGDVLMSLRNFQEQAEVAVAQQEAVLASAERDQVIAGVNPYRIIAAERNVELLLAQLRNAKRHYQRIHKVYERGATTVSDDDGAETDVARLSAQVRLAQAELEHLKNFVRSADRAVSEARVALAQARLESARRRLDETMLKAPFDGSVLEILKREGEAAHAAKGDAVLVFADNSRLRIRAEIDERYVHRLAAGQIACISGRGLGQHRFAGQVSLVKKLMGKKTVFARDAAERKDLDVVQCWIDTADEFRPPLGLQVDVEIEVGPPTSPADERQG